VNDKWDEKEPEKGHKLVDYAGRYVAIPGDPAGLKNTGADSNDVATGYVSPSRQLIDGGPANRKWPSHA
jgi:hypothetical protein